MKRFALTLAAFMLTAGSLYADTATMVRDGLTMCAKHAPNIRKARADLEALGWIDKGISEDLRVYLAPGFDGVGAIPAASFNLNGCGFGAKGMSAKQSTKLAASLVKTLFGNTAAVATADDLNDNRIIAAWTGKVNGIDAGLAVYKEVNYTNIYRGSMIFLLLSQ